MAASPACWTWPDSGPASAALCAPSFPLAPYVTADGDVLEEICWRRYGREDAVPHVLAANPGLADGDPVLPGGKVLVLPDLPRLPPTLRLWTAAPAGAASAR